MDDPVVRDGTGAVVGPGMSRRRPSDCPLPVQKWLKHDAVDLAVELEGYDGSPPVKSTYTLADLNGMRISTSHRVPLSQLQAQGFNTTPPPGHRIDMALKSIGKALGKIIDEPDVGGPGTPNPSPPT